VLVADDDRDIRELVTLKLTQAGYRVLAVGDGIAALETIRAGGVSVAVLDVMMPGMSGLDVLRQIRAEDHDHTVAVVLLTARSQEPDVESGIALGADDYVVKPFSPRELVRRVDAVIARDR
jgi:DNA-binding response OmpR family regulator